MAKKQKSKSLKSKHKLSKKRLLVAVTLIVLVACAAGGYLVYRHQQNINRISAEQKQQYDEVDRQMQRVMAKVVKAAGKPYELHHTHVCDHTAQEWGHGELGCSIIYRFTYEVNSVKQGSSLTAKTLPAIESLEGERIAKNPGSGIKDKLDYEYFLDIHTIACVYSYQSESKELYNSSLGQGYNKSIKFSLAAVYSYTCGGRATRPLYPVED